MKRKVLAITLPIMLLANVGCSADWIFTKDNEKEVHAIEKKNKKAEENYSDSLSKLGNKLETDIIDLQGLFFASNETGEEELNNKVSVFKNTTSKIKKLKPSKDYEEAHKSVIKAMDLYDSGLDLRLDSMKNKDQKGIEEGKEKMNEAKDKLTDARKQVNSVDLQKSRQQWR
ncbi:hypothetical protein COF68_04855 [Bacillus toyonensis]|uniref:hypothetical protein n=1 Tax=Bacillus toyonensis TaxID=155322 RepID=UPI000BFE1446|nr:hypothetical protein [Bacillus toyonensis]PHE64180.1 hypothetical protein COF68_04855 [Bacillus toyonensis]